MRLKMLLVLRRDCIYKRCSFCTSPKFSLPMILAQIALQIYSRVFFSLINEIRQQYIPIAQIQLLKGVICREQQYCIYCHLALSFTINLISRYTLAILLYDKLYDSNNTKSRCSFFFFYFTLNMPPDHQICGHFLANLPEFLAFNVCMCVLPLVSRSEPELLSFVRVMFILFFQLNFQIQLSSSC